MVNRSDFNSQEFLTLEACSPGAKSLPEILASPICIKSCIPSQVCVQRGRQSDHILLEAIVAVIESTVAT